MILTAGERGVRQISGRVLSQELLLQVSVAARSARRHARRPNVLEDSLSHLRPGRTQLLRDVHHRHDHYQQLGIGQFSTASLAPGFDTWTPPLGSLQYRRSTIRHIFLRKTKLGGVRMLEKKLVDEVARPEGRRAGVGFFGRGQQARHHYLGDMGERCKLLSGFRGSLGRQMIVLHFKSSSLSLQAKKRTCFCEC